MSKVSTAVILAAGQGSRLMPLTSKIPKAMVKYQNKEIISYQIDNLKELDVDNIIVVVGYHSKVLINFLQSKYNKIKIILNDNFAKTNSAYSFNCAVNEIKSDTYIHLNCDILFSIELLSKLINSKYENAICVRKDLFLGDKMENVSVKNNNLISNMSLRKRNDTKFKAYGLAKINRKSFEQNIKYFYNLSEKIRNNENYYGLIRNNLKKNDYHIIRSNKYNLAEINNHDDLKVCLFNN